MDIQLNLQDAENEPTWDSDSLARMSNEELGANLTEIISDDSFVIEVPSVVPSMGDNYPFTVGFNSPLPKLGFSVQSCQIVVAATDTAEGNR